MPEILVDVKMNLLELKLFRRALAKAADDGILKRTPTLYRICALDALRWEAEEKVLTEQKEPQKDRPAA